MSANRRHAAADVTGIVAATIAASVIMSWILGTSWHWLLVLPGLIFGVWVVQKIR